MEDRMNKIELSLSRIDEDDRMRGAVDSESPHHDLLWTSRDIYTVNRSTVGNSEATNRRSRLPRYRRTIHFPCHTHKHHRYTDAIICANPVPKW